MRRTPSVAPHHSWMIRIVPLLVLLSLQSATAQSLPAQVPLALVPSAQTLPAQTSPSQAPPAQAPLARTLPAESLTSGALTGVTLSGVVPEAAEIRPAAAPRPQRPGPGTRLSPRHPAVTNLARIDEGGRGQPIVLTTTKARQISMPVDVRDVVVADSTVADVLIKTPRLVYLIGSKVGDTNAIFLDAAGRQVLKLEIRVDRDLTALRSALTRLVPTADVKVEPLGQDLVVSGDVPSAASADSVRQLVRRFVEKDENLVNMLKVTGSQQVVIKVKVAEVQRTVTKKLGVDFLTSYTNRALLGTGGAAALTANPGVLSTSIAGTFSQPFAIARFLAGGSLATIEALEKNQLLKVLAEPNLTALSGEPASFLAGGEYPVPGGVDSSGNVSITFKPFGVSLAFTPVVLGSGRISLRISTEVSELSDEGAVVLQGWSIKALAVRRAQTTVEIPSGGSLMLGGLLRNDVANAAQGVPGLKDVPILGALFRSNDFLRGETEMVVIATPYVVRPTTPGGVTAPTDGFAPASDIDMYFLNGLYARYGAGKAPGKVDRTTGYIIR